MTRPRRCVVPGLGVTGCLAIALLSVPLGADSQTIEGVLTDTRTGRGISGAQVTLFDTLGVERDATETGQDGGFVVHGGGAGVFLISVHRPGYADRLSDEIHLSEGERVSYRMDVSPLSSDQVESMQSTLASNDRIRQVLVDTCAGRIDPANAGLVLGVVRDRTGEQGVGGARVVLASPGGEPLIAVTDRLGGYVFCAAPPGSGQPLTVTAEGWNSSVQEIEVRAGVISWYDFRLRVRER